MKMNIIKIKNKVAEIEFRKDELAMLCTATGGAIFRNTQYRDIPVLSYWTKNEALQFEQGIRDYYKKLSGDTQIITLNEKELRYLLKIHMDNMQELDPVEYPTITGYTWEEAVQLQEKLQDIIR